MGHLPRRWTDAADRMLAAVTSDSRPPAGDADQPRPDAPDQEPDLDDEAYDPEHFEDL